MMSSNKEVILCTKADKMAVDSAASEEAKDMESKDTVHVTGELLGRKVEFEYSAGAIAYAILALRLVMGWTFLQAGLDKVFDSEWTAAGFLKFGIPEGNPFASAFADMAGSGFVDFLVQWGQVAIGLALIFGFLTRWSVFCGAVMMLLFWAASLQGGLGEFLPFENGWVVDDHLVYAVLLFGLGALGAGRILGVDRYIEEMDFVKQNRWTKYLLG
jgi:thiosulfate dehydrogenase [quinone] large subunit